MKTLIDEFALRYPGIEKVGHVYFYAVHGADEAKRRSYLERADSLGYEGLRALEKRAGPGREASTK